MALKLILIGIVFFGYSIACKSVCVFSYNDIELNDIDIFYGSLFILNAETCADDCQRVLHVAGGQLLSNLCYFGAAAYLFERF